jgi:hypothetical protein
MYPSFRVLLLAFSALQAEFLVQASVGQQVSSSVVRMSGYQVDYDSSERSPYDVGVGYILSLKDFLVLPVVLEANPVSLSNIYDQDVVTEIMHSPLELHLKPGIQFDDYQVNALVGFELGQFEQKLDSSRHEFKLGLLPSFYGAGFSRALSEYMDYFAELQIYYQSELPYAIDLEAAELDKSLKVVDSSIRLGLRVRV